MRKINIANSRQRNAQVGFDLPKATQTIIYAREDGQDYNSTRILKTDISTNISHLINSHGNDLTDCLISADPEINIETVGKYLRQVKKIYIAPDGKAAYKVSRRTIFYTPEGKEKSAQKYHTSQANVNTDIPLRWTGRLIDKNKAVRMFVFSRKYQIRHINGLTFDFLYDMARQLHESNSLMLLGAGSKGNAPLVMTTGGVSYRAFLEGRIDGDKYSLLLHLTNLELKAVE